MSVLIGKDRTIKQPVRAFCRNPKCRKTMGVDFEFQVEHDRFCCPKCGADREPFIGVLSLTHHLVPDPKGPIVGLGGRRFKLGCETRRAYLATATNNESATDQPPYVNCPGCLEAIRKLGIVDPTGTPINVSQWSN